MSITRIGAGEKAQVPGSGAGRAVSPIGFRMAGDVGVTVGLIID